MKDILKFLYELRRNDKIGRRSLKKCLCSLFKISVGACVLTESGNVYTGCNFENSSYGMTICAERNAIGTAIASGERKIKAVAIFSPKMKNCTPVEHADR